MVFLNKYLLSSQDLKFDAPIFVTWFQCLISFLTYSSLLKYKQKFPNSLPFFQIFSVDYSVSLKVLQSHNDSHHFEIK